MPDDIGTIKIPQLFSKFVQKDCQFEVVRELPEEQKLNEFSLAIHCAGCMVTRKKVLTRIELLNKYNIPSINYGLFFAYVNDLLPRALKPFAEEYKTYLQNCSYKL